MGIIRKTQALKSLMEQFEKQSSAISTIQLIKLLDSKFNKTTIYRVLDKLEQDGVLHSFLGNNGIKWYAKCQGCSKSNHKDVHPHFQCVSCGKMDCLHIKVDLPLFPNRKTLSTHVLIKGECESCLST
jgi:Fur family ferric uptake transcriptional regulator